MKLLLRGGGSRHVYCVALLRAPRSTIEYACGALGRAPCIHAGLRRLAAAGRFTLNAAFRACELSAVDK